MSTSPSMLLIRGGTVMDSSGERRADVLVEGSSVRSVAPDIDAPKGALTLDAEGCIVAPGLVDLHVHLRQPGGESAETVESGARAAALGGFTAVVAMPNTDPPIDDAAVAHEVLSIGEKAVCQVAVAGAITKGREGEHLAPMGELAALGIRLFTDDGRGVQDAGVMRRALEYAKGLGVTLAQHCETQSLVGSGVMHEGDWSSRLGLAGVPGEAEETMVARDIALARMTGAPIHFLHLSTARSADLVRVAKQEGLAVTAEVTPHHLSLTDAELASYDAVYKVNPPLRTKDDVSALCKACASGFIDAIASDHAPHPSHAKDTTLDQASPGMLGLQTALPVSLTALFGGPLSSGDGTGAPLRDDGYTIGLRDVVAMLSWRPARIARLAVDQGGDQGGPIVEGAVANICVFDPSSGFELRADQVASLSRNTPWLNKSLRGKVRHTVFRGEPVVIDAVAQR